MATVKTIRQVKTVFIIFIVFVCCWSPYVIVLLYDSSDTLPLPFHLYTSMLAHLHASVNFAIYSLSTRTYRAGYRRLAADLVDCCRRGTKSRNAVSAAAYNSRDTYRTNGLRSRRITANRTMVTVECLELQETAR